MTVCSLMLNGPVLNVQRTPKVLKTFFGTTLAQRHPIGYTSLSNNQFNCPVTIKGIFTAK